MLTKKYVVVREIEKAPWLLLFVILCRLSGHSDGPAYVVCRTTTADTGRALMLSAVSGVSCVCPGLRSKRAGEFRNFKECLPRDATHPRY